MAQSPHNMNTNFLDRAVNAAAVIGFTGLVFIAFLTLADVILRYLGWVRVPGFNDLGEVAYAVVIASCFPAGLKKGNAVAVRLLGPALNRHIHGWLEAWAATLMLIFFILVAWQFSVMTIDYATAGRTTSTLEWPIAPFWALVTMIVTSCVGVQSWVLWTSIKAALSGQPHDNSSGGL